jgi:tetratricopeptide (TPR) repeat protein
MSSDWYRNTAWDETIERRFNEKLRRVKLKAQYLRIQASTLARTHPEAALKLLEQYFETPDDVERAQAHVDRATALQTLGRGGDAVAAYEAALAREAEYPRVETQAHLDLPFHVAVHRLSDHYDRALELLEAHKERLLFPVDHFRWHAAQALIAADKGQAETAVEHRAAALKAAAAQYSGFDSHPRAGLVKDRYNDVIDLLEDIAVTARST